MLVFRACCICCFPCSVGQFSYGTFSGTQKAPLQLIHTVPPPFLCRQPLLHWITFLGSANWSHMSGIPQTKGFYFLLHKDPYCTQQAQILGGVKEKWRGSVKPYLFSKGEIESRWNLPTGEKSLS